MDPDQTARMRRLVWIHAGRKPIMLVLSWHGSFYQYLKNINGKCAHCKPNFTLKIGIIS
jgi:hypothetical protein